MKLTELIEQATKALEEHGDIPVLSYEKGCGCFSTGPFEATTSVTFNVRLGSVTIPVAFEVEG